MKKHFKTIVLMLLTVFVLACFTGALMTRAKAFGDYNDYDYGSSSDWGGSSDWGSSSDWGDSDYSSSGGSGSGFLIGILVDLFFKHPCCCSILAVIGIIIFVIVKAINKKNGPKGGGNIPQNRPNNYREIPNNNQPQRRQAKVAKSMPNRSNEIANIIEAHDPLFTEPDFITYAKDVYMDIQDAWCKRDLTDVQAVLHSNLYDRTKKQLDKKIADKVQPHLDRITVNEAYMTFYRKDSQFEYATVYLSSSMIDYQTNEVTGEILFGDKTTRWEMHYLMTFMRSLNIKTPEAGAAKKAFNCPNCGGVMDRMHFGECPFCGSIVKSGEYGWVLSDFNAVKDSTPDQGIEK